MSNTFVYLVGDKNSPQTNQWLAMCSSEDAADEFEGTLSGPVTRKTIEVKEPYYRGKRKG